MTRVIPARLNGKHNKGFSGIAVGKPSSGGASQVIGPMMGGSGWTVPPEVFTEDIVLNGSDCFLPDVLVATTRTRVEGALKSFKADKALARRAFTMTWDIIKKADTDALHADADKSAWCVLMETVADYYAARCALFGTPIPIVSDPRARRAVMGMKANGAHAHQISIPDDEDEEDTEENYQW